MRFPRIFVLAGFLVFLASTAFAQDSLLGKRKGKGSSSNPPANSGGSHSGQSKDKDRGSRNSTSKDDNSKNSDDQTWSNDQQRDTSDNSNRRQKQGSRSGRVNYNSTNNLLNKQDGKRQPLKIQRAPSREDLDKDTSNMRDQVRREDRSQVRYRDNDNRGHGKGDWNDSRYRVGYYHYRSNWRDDNFCYPYYVFNPYMVDQCVVSPWYYYSFLPAYVEYDRIVYSNSNYGAFFGAPYEYEPIANRRDDFSNERDSVYDNNYVGRRALDYAIDDIVSAFKRDDRRAVDHLVPRSGSVLLGVDAATTFGVRADDFYDMLMDVTQNSRTIDYQIVSVAASNDEAEVVAEHEFVDSWGTHQFVYHRYHLFGERGNIVVRFFETSNNPIL